MRVAAAILLALPLAGSARPDGAILSDAYVWQMRWTAALAASIAANGDLFRAWHVLAAEISPDDTVATAKVDWSWVEAGGHTVVPVDRIEGRITPARTPHLLSEIQAVLASLPRPIQGQLEIDYDCATAHLGDYAGFIRALRTALPPKVALSVTVLPTWLAAPEFASVADAADLLVLQVHAIDDARLGLFDPARAGRWVDALSRRTSRPFLVALPAYGARVAATESGRVLAISAEMPAFDGQAGEEIAASPVEVASFLDAMRQDPPVGMRGVVWFRLPTAEDRRAWSQATLRAVVRGQKLRSRIEIIARPGHIDGVSDILVTNQGDTDGMLPIALALPPGCRNADGVGQYVIDGGNLVLRGRASSLLPPHAAAVAGWMRCGERWEQLHAQE